MKAKAKLVLARWKIKRLKEELRFTRQAARPMGGRVHEPARREEGEEWTSGSSRVEGERTVNAIWRRSFAACLSLAVLSPTCASAHCFSIWHFHEPQRCGGNNRPPVVSIAKRETVPAQLPPMPGPSFDIPLPDPDPLTTALKAQLQ
jgi:hypothetical protein